MKKFARAGLAVLAAAGLFWGWRILFPSDDKLILKLLNQLAARLSVRPNQSALSRLARGSNLDPFFTPDIVVEIEVAGRDWSDVQGREELMRAIQAALGRLRQSDIRFYNIAIGFSPDRQTANTHLVALGYLNGETDPMVYELNVVLKKQERKWAISHVQTAGNHSSHGADSR